MIVVQDLDLGILIEIHKKRIMPEVIMSWEIMSRGDYVE
jgi:hypothetical protein